MLALGAVLSALLIVLAGASIVFTAIPQHAILCDKRCDG